MKKIILILIFAIVFVGSFQDTSAQLEERDMLRFAVPSKVVQLKKGTMTVYDFGEVKLHSYETRDFFNSHVLFLEKNGKGILIETPPMKDNHAPLIEYISKLGHKSIDAMISYHLIGENFFKTKKLKFNNIYSDKNAVAYMSTSGGESLEGLKKVSGQEFDDSVIKPTKLLKKGQTEIAGIKFIVIPTGIGFDVEIPEIKAVHSHIIGHDNHTLVFNSQFIDTSIAELRRFQENGYNMYFSSHSDVETNGDITLKIKYLEDMKIIYSESGNGKEFFEKMNKAYPYFGWQNYLLGSAAMLFKTDKTTNINADSMIIQLVVFDIKTEQIATFKTTAKRSLEESLKEPGNLEMKLYEDKENPNILYVFSRWKDEAAMKYHGEQSHTKDLQKLAKTSLNSPPKVTTMNEIKP